MVKKPVSEVNLKRLEHLSIYLKELRYNSGMTQKELSQNANLHLNTIHHAENSENVTLLSIFDLCDALDIDIKDLFSIIE